MAEKKCANHPVEQAVTVCSSCRRGLCSACWQRNLNGNPCCELCLHHLTSTGTNLAIAVAFLLVCSGVAARVPWDRSRKGSKSEALSDALSWGCDPLGCGDLTGCGETAFVLTLVAAILGAVWLMVELAVPALFFLAYFLVRTSLARVANDHHDCESHLGRALGWGLVWASLYAAPLALVIFVAHRLLAKG